MSIASHHDTTPMADGRCPTCGTDMVIRAPAQRPEQGEDKVTDELIRSMHRSMKSWKAKDDEIRAMLVAAGVPEDEQVGDLDPERASTPRMVAAYIASRANPQPQGEAKRDGLDAIEYVLGAANLSDPMSDHDWLQLTQAAAGCVSGIDNWPHLRIAIAKVVRLRAAVPQAEAGKTSRNGMRVEILSAMRRADNDVDLADTILRLIDAYWPERAPAEAAPGVTEALENVCDEWDSLISGRVGADLGVIPKDAKYRALDLKRWANLTDAVMQGRSALAAARAAGEGT